MNELSGYFEQFRGDDDPWRIISSNNALFSPGNAEEMKACEERGGHDWYPLYGGARCVRCGAQITFNADKGFAKEKR